MFADDTEGMTEDQVKWLKIMDMVREYKNRNESGESLSRLIVDNAFKGLQESGTSGMIRFFEREMLTMYTGLQTRLFWEKVFDAVYKSPSLNGAKPALKYLRAVLTSNREHLVQLQTAVVNMPFRIAVFSQSEIIAKQTACKELAELIGRVEKL